MKKLGGQKREKSTSSTSGDDTPVRKKPAGTVSSVIEESSSMSLMNKEVIDKIDFLAEEMKKLRHSQDSLQEVISTQISDLRRDLVADIDRRFTKMTTNVHSQMNRLDGQMRSLESKVASLDDLKDRVEALQTQAQAGYLPSEHVTDNPCANPEVTVIASNVPHLYDEDPITVAQHLVSALGEHVSSVKVISAHRLESRNHQKPGLLKIAFRSLDEKKCVLKSKWNLKDSPGYAKVFLRSSKSHMERIQEYNTRQLLDLIPNGKQYRITAHGKMIKKGQNDTEVQKPEPSVRKDGNRNKGPDSHNSATNVTGSKNGGLGAYQLPPPLQRSPKRHTKAHERPKTPPPPPPAQPPPTWVATGGTQNSQEDIHQQSDQTRQQDDPGSMDGLDKISLTDNVDSPQ